MRETPDDSQDDEDPDADAKGEVKPDRCQVGRIAARGEPFTIVERGIDAEEQQRDEPVQRYCDS
jgi:hypothetical protein